MVVLGGYFRGHTEMEKHLIQEIKRRFKRTPASRRVTELREFMERSDANRKLIRKAFPDLYQEATSPEFRSSAVSSSEPVQPVELCAKPR